MSTYVACRCGQAFNAPENLAGRTVACPACKQPLAIPLRRNIAQAQLPPHTFSNPTNTYPAGPYGYGVPPGNSPSPNYVPWIIGGIGAVVAILFLGIVAITISRLGSMPRAVANTTPPVGYQPTWKSFESKGDNFKVLLPVDPRHEKSEDGKENIYLAASDEGRRVFQVRCEHDCDSSISFAQRFEQVGSLPDVRGPVKTMVISLGKYPGMEATYEMTDERSTHFLKHRIYDVGSNSYQVMAIWKKGENAEADVERFLSSFQLLSQ